RSIPLTRARNVGVECWDVETGSLQQYDSRKDIRPCLGVIVEKWSGEAHCPTNNQESSQFVLVGKDSFWDHASGKGHKSYGLDQPVVSSPAIIVALFGWTVVASVVMGISSR